MEQITTQDIKGSPLRMAIRDADCIDFCSLGPQFFDKKYTSFNKVFNEGSDAYNDFDNLRKRFSSLSFEQHIKRELYNENFANFISEYRGKEIPSSPLPNIEVKARKIPINKNPENKSNAKNESINNDNKKEDLGHIDQENENKPDLNNLKKEVIDESKKADTQIEKSYNFWNTSFGKAIRILLYFVLIGFAMEAFGVYDKKKTSKNPKKIAPSSSVIIDNSSDKQQTINNLKAPFHQKLLTAQNINKKDALRFV